jgi:transcriptional regulator with XRE-family HTH domain
MKGVGLNVKNRRLARKLTQQQLAERVGRTQSLIAQIETGTYTPSLAMLARIAKALKTTLADLVK